MTSAYAIVSVDGKWSATSVHSGHAATGNCPFDALTNVRTAERDGPKIIPPREIPAVDEAVGLCCKMLGLDFGDLAGHGRVCDVVARRAVLYYLLWHHGNGRSRVFSTPELAKACHKPNHSTIITGANRCIPATTLPEWCVVLADWEATVRARKARPLDGTHAFRVVLNHLRDQTLGTPP